MPKKALRAVGYCRTSGEGQRDNTSIPRQRTAIEKSCKASGWTFVEHYVDECKSGAKTEGREDYKRMLQDAAAGKFDLIVPFDATRFARDGLDIVSTAKFLKSEFGIFVVDAKNQFDNRSHRNSLRNFVQAGVSEWERLSIMERSVGGRIEKAKAGLMWAGKPPFGRKFTKSATDKNAGIWSVTDEGRKLAALLERYAEGELLSDLVPEYGFGSNHSVLRIVRESQLSANPYVVTFDSPEIGIEKLEVPVPAMPPIISPELEKRVRERMQHNRTWNKQSVRKYLLTGFVRCTRCGVALTGKATERGLFYRHVAVVQPGVDCRFRSAPGKLVEGQVLDFLYRWFIDQPAFDAAISEAMPKASHRKKLEKEICRLERDLARVEREIGNLVDSVAQGVDPSLLVGKQDELKKERDALQARLANQHNQLESMPDPDALREEAEILRLMIAQEQIGKDWSSEKFDDVRRFLHFLFGDNPKKEGLGVFVDKVDGKWVAEIRARLRLRDPVLLLGAEGFARPLNTSADGEPVDWRIAPQRINLVRNTF